MGAPRTVLIVGAGIAGLSLALGLAKFGLRVTVIERAETISEFGAGLQISPNARKCLDRLGLAEAVAARGFEPEAIDLYPKGAITPLQSLVLGEVATQKYGAPYAVMHRGDLVDILHSAARRFANIEIVTGVKRFEATEAPDGLAVEFEEPDGRSRPMRPFAMVGADGVRSMVRTECLAGSVALYSGKIAWRALADPERLANHLDLTRTSVLFGPDYHLVAYPLPHRNTVNLALFTQESQSRLDSLEKGQPTIRSHPDNRLGGILEAVGVDWTPWVLATVTTDIWHKGSIGLLGDAAHAMLPFQAQGAAMGIEDAAVLAPLLASAPDAAHAFSRYAALRQDRVRKVQAVSARNGRIFHMRWPLSMARDLVIRLEGPLGHFKRLDWLYGYDPYTDAQKSEAGL